MTKPPAEDKLLQYKAPGEAETLSLPGSSNRCIEGYIPLGQ